MDEFNLDNTGKYGQTSARKNDVQFEIEPRRSPRREPEEKAAFHFGSRTDEDDGDELPELPTRYDHEDSFSEDEPEIELPADEYEPPIPVGREAESMDEPADESVSAGSADDIVHQVQESIETSYPIPEPYIPVASAEDTFAAPAQEEAPLPQPEEGEYLSQDEYEQQEPEETGRYVSREQPPKKRGGFFSFLKKRSAARQDAEEQAAQAEPLSPALGPDDYPDSDPAAEPPEEPLETRDTFADEEPDVGRIYEIHSGSRGRAEQEARELIANMQARSGSAGRRSRRSSADYRVELDDMLGMDGGADASIPSPAPEAVSASEGGEPYSFSLDQAMDYDADVKEYHAKNERPVYQPDAKEPEIDERFHLGGQSPRQTISYANNEVDLSADEDYVPAQQTEYSPTQWTPDYDDPLAERQDTTEPPRKKHRSLLGRFKKPAAAAEEPVPEEEPAKEPVQELRDTDAAPAVYAVSTDARDDPDYLAAPESIDDTDAEDEDFDDELDDDESHRRYRESDMYAPPTFREYLLSILASVWLRLRGTVRGRTAQTMRDSEEDLGQELTPAEASKYYGSFLRSMKYRLRISAVALAVLLYISLEMPVPGMMKSLPTAAAFCFGMQAVIMLLSLDVVTNALSNMLHMRFGADGLVLISCLFSGIDALIVALSKTAARHMPLCAISSACVVGLLLGSYLSARGLRKATRVPAIGKHFFAVTGENTLEKDQITLLKSLRSVHGFVRRTEEAGPDETLYNRLAPVLFVVSLLLTIIVMIAKKSYPEFIYILSAQLSLTVPFGALLSFSLPFFLGSSRIFKFGAAIAGWSGLCDIGASKNLIVTDRDLFPESAVSIESVRIFADEDAQKVISYAGSMMQASGCCSAGCFGELMRETDSPARPIDGFEVMPGGGMKGIIEGHVVLCGSTDLMRLMNVRIPFRLTDKTTVLLAIDGILYGIFSLKYEGQPQVRRALVDLVRTARPPVFAVRDFNVNPEMLHNTFDIATDGYDFPPYVERFRLSEPSDDAKDERIAAILCNEGLAPLTSVADIGRSMFLATNINLILNVIASILGVALVFIRFLTAGANPLANLFLYLVFWTLPVLLVSFFVSVKR